MSPYKKEKVRYMKCRKHKMLLKILAGSSVLMIVSGMMCMSGCSQKTDETDFMEGTFYMEESTPGEGDSEGTGESLPADTSQEGTLDGSSESSGSSSYVESADTETDLQEETSLSETESAASQQWEEPVQSQDETESVVIPPTQSGIFVKDSHMAQLSAARIMEINQNSINNPAAGRYQVTSLRQLSRAEAVGLILVYSFPEYPYYAGHGITPEERAALEANRNIDAVPETVAVQYGILTDNANVRTYPTVHPITASNRYEDFDYFQETMFSLGEMVAVLHTSADGQFVFVVGANDKGWVERSKVGMTDLATVQQWESALMHPAVVTEPYVRLDNGAVLRMGTVLPLLSNDGTNYCIWYPVNQGGAVQLTQISVPVRNDISDGYLPFTYDGVVKRMQQMNGVSYGWGDVHLNFDCSSTVGAVYRCFGIYLPRNTGQMHGTGTSVYELNGLSLEERLGKIQSAPPGSLLVMPGHVVMYFGVINGTPMISHNVTRYSENGVDVIEANQCWTTSLHIYTGSGRLYPEAFAWLVVFE